MNYQQALGLAAATAITVATFGSIDAYATSLSRQAHDRVFAPTAAMAQIDRHLALALSQSQRQVQAALDRSVLALAPSMNVEPLATQLVRR